MPKSTKPRLRDRLGIGGRSSRATSPVPPPASNSNPATAQPLSVLIVTGGSPTPSGDENPAFAEALKRHIQEISSAEQQAFLDSDKITESSILQRIREHDETHCSKSYQRKCAPGVTKFLTALKTYMGPVTTMIGHSPEFSSLVVGGFKLIVDLGLKLVNFFDRLTAMLEFLSVHLGYLATYGTTFRESTEVQEALILTYRDLLQFFTKARKVFVDKEGKPKRWVSFRVFWRVSWEDFESEYQQLSSQFSNHSMTVVRIANAEEYGRIRNKETLEQRNQEREERRKILLWLSDLDFDHDHDRIFSTRHDDTGRWLVESREFTQWHDSQESSILWCHGTPGVGKTVLTSIVLETISARHCANDRVGLAFFYFNFQRQERQTPVKVLGTFLKQLARQRQQLPDHLKLFHRYYYKDALFPSEQKLEAQLIELSSSFERVFLIIDAMDEHDDRKPTLAMLTRLAQNGPAIFKVFFTSRKEKDINRAFEKFPTIQVEARMVDRDIRKYIMDQMHHRTAETSIDEQLKAEITNTLISQSNGMFLWVKFQLDNIYSQPTSREIRKALRSLPEDIDATYNRILEKIDKQGATERKAARRALCWIAGAARPLTPDELSTAVSLEPEDTHFLGLESYGIEWIIGVCGNLLFHDEEASLIRPVHMTVVEFLKDFNIDDCDSGTPKHLKKYKFINAMHTSLAMQCLQVISFQDIQVQTSLRGFLGPSRFGNQPFLGYSSRYWVFHYRALSSVPAILFEAISRFLTSPRRPFQVANSIAKDLNKDVTVEEFCVDLDLLDLYLSISPFNQERLTEQPYLLFIAAKGGHIASMQKLLDIGFDINKEMYGNTALIYALSLGQEEAATILLARGANANLPDISLCVRSWNTSTKLFKLLVEKGADVIGQCYDGRNVLQWATISGRDGIVKFLIDKGIHPDAQPFGSSGTASLYHAAEMGNLGIVRLLLSRGADPMRRGGHYHSALGTAVYWGRLEIVRLLLERGADPTQECGHHHSVLEAAVYLERLEVAKLLLEYGADPTQQGGYYGSALGAAAYSGRLEMVKLLLEHGADPTQQGGHYGSALGVAVHSGHLEIVKLFLEHGADPTQQGRLYGSALGAAVHSGHLGIVKILLEHGAGHTEQGGHYGSALGVAARLGHLEIVKLLLECGANPTQQDGHYVSALGAAACSGHLEVVKLLLEHGVDPTEQGGLEGSALVAAACSGDLEIVKLLLEHGAYPTQHDRLYGSALGAAACSGHLEVVKLLLEHGVNPTEQGGPEGSALAAAVCSGDLEIVKLLLEHGADPTQQDGHYGSALGVAACLGHLEVVELLLERGADATEQGGHYGSALGAAACSGEPEIVELLLEHGADPTEQGGHYGSALGVAACSGHLEVVELLLEHGADPTEQGGHYGIALGVAAYSGYLEVVESLLQHGADPTQQGGYYGSALIAAALTGANGTITLLLDHGADIDYRGGFYHSTIVASVIYALRSDNIETLDLLIDNGADIYSQCGQNANDLLDAINSRHLRDPILQRDSYIQGLRSMGLFSERRLQCLQRQEGWGLYDSYSSDSDME